MKTLSLNKYSPIISDKSIGQEIYDSIDNYLKKGESVEIDLGSIKSMATFCAKQIFGKLYLSLGSQTFFERVVIKNASEDVKTIIRIGIQNAIQELQ